MESQNLSTDLEAVDSLGELCEAFAYRSSAHGIPRIVISQGRFRKLLWVLVFASAVSCFGYHSIYLIVTYLTYPCFTTTDEVHATEIEFPSLTICNINSLKKQYFETSFSSHVSSLYTPTEYDSRKTIFKIKKDRLDLLKREFLPSEPQTKHDESIDSLNICMGGSIDEFISKSQTMDLSDMWMSLVANKETLSKYGHQAADLIVQCTYNSRNCFNGSFSIIDVETTTSPRFGLCHTMSIGKERMRKLTKTGSTFGLRLTLNIERDDYMEQIVPEYGARLLIHQYGTFPSLQQGGIILKPGTKSYISIKMRRIERLLEPYSECSNSFITSPLGDYLRQNGQEYLLRNKTYTLEFCQALCREAGLLRTCGCSEDISVEGESSCDSCNSTQVKCRSQFYRRYSQGTTKCLKLCKPACLDVRYDTTVSHSEWPSFPQQAQVLKRWPDINRKLATFVTTHTAEDLQRLEDRKFEDRKENFEFDVESVRGNFLRVHIYLQEMNYLWIKDKPGYTLSQLFADLGGCLGLYIGVSAITLVETIEHLVNITCFFYVRRNRKKTNNCQEIPSSRPEFRRSSIHVIDLTKVNEKQSSVERHPRSKVIAH